jgi:hypothetical protein
MALKDQLEIESNTASDFQGRSDISGIARHRTQLQERKCERASKAIEIQYAEKRQPLQIDVR